MKNYISIIICVVALFLNLMITMFSGNMNAHNETDYQRDPVYNVKIVNLIIDKIIKREIIEDTYLNYIKNVDLTEDIKGYNKRTSGFILGYTRHSIEILSMLYSIEENDFTQEIKDMAQKITKYALYRNATELIISDYQIAQIISKELGGSYGAWPWHIHLEENNNIGMSNEDLEEYFNFVDGIIEKLELYKTEPQNPQ